MNPRDRLTVLTLIGKAVARLQLRMTAITQALVQAEVANRLATTPRRAEFTLTNIATGTGTTQAVTWVVPIAGDYAVTVSPTCAAAAVGLLTGGVQALSKTTTGCTIVVANRTGSVLAAATFDVLAFPL